MIAAPLISLLIVLICIFIISSMVGNVFFRERKSGACNDQAGLNLIWLLAGVYLCAASVFVRSHKMNTLRQTSFFAVSSSHTRAKNIPRPVRPSPPTPVAYLTSLYHHHLQAHRKYFTLLLLRARGRVYCSGVKYRNCACKIMTLVKKNVILLQTIS